MWKGGGQGLRPFSCAHRFLEPGDVPEAIELAAHLSEHADPAEVESWKGKDPIARIEQQLREQGDLDDAGMVAIEREIITALDAAVAFAEASPFPLPEQATEDAFAA